MRIKHGFNTGMIKKVFNKIMLKALAEEVTPPTGEPTTEPTATATTQTASPTINYEDLIAKARADEKGKLYPQIQKLEGDKKSLTEKLNANLLIIGEKEAEIVRLNEVIKSLEKGDESEVVTGLKEEIKTLKNTITSLEENTVSRESIEEEIKAEYDVKLYREQKLRDVDSSLADLVMGGSIEEIDASVIKAQEVFTTIQNKVMGSVSVPSVNISTSTLNSDNIGIEDIMKLDPRSPEYAEMRIKLGLAR